MKNLILMMLIVLSPLAQAGEPEMKEVREMYFFAAKDEEKCLEMISLLSSQKENNSLLWGYLASAEMLMAKHAFNPFTKMDYFKKGRAKLDEAIAKDPENMELRALRLAVQKNAPSFLNYSSDMEEDKTLIIKKWQTTSDAPLKKHLISLMQRSDSMSSSELASLQDNI